MLGNGSLRLLSLAGVGAVLLAMAAAVLQWWTDVGPWRDLGPHRFCWQNRPVLVYGTAAADAVIWLAYWTIPLEVVWLTRRGHLPWPSVAYLLACFVMACGATHAMDLWTIWTPTYYAAVTVKALTAIVSLAFAAVVGAGVWRLKQDAAGLAERLRVASTQVTDLGLARALAEAAEAIDG